MIQPRVVVACCSCCIRIRIPTFRTNSIQVNKHSNISSLYISIKNKYIHSAVISIKYICPKSNAHTVLWDKQESQYNRYKTGIRYILSFNNNTNSKNTSDSNIHLANIPISRIILGCICNSCRSHFKISKLMRSSHLEISVKVYWISTMQSATLSYQKNLRIQLSNQYWICFNLLRINIFKHLYCSERVVLDDKNFTKGVFIYPVLKYLGICDDKIQFNHYWYFWLFIYGIADCFTECNYESELIFVFPI